MKKRSARSENILYILILLMLMAIVRLMNEEVSVRNMLCTSCGRGERDGCAGVCMF